MSILSVVPVRGFYYHYKHDPTGPVNNYAYELIGVGCHTESNCRPEDRRLAIYRPLYSDAFVFTAGRLFDVRPLSMWFDTVTKNGVTTLRFQLITDQKVVMALQEIKEKMYP